MADKRTNTVELMIGGAFVSAAAIGLTNYFMRLTPRDIFFKQMLVGAAIGAGGMAFCSLLMETEPQKPAELALKTT